MVEVCGLGGYDECGRNTLAVKVGNDAVVMDMGYHMQHLVNLDRGNGQREFSTDEMIKAQVVADDSVVKSWWSKVRGIALSHNHLDHVGGVPYLEKHYKAPIYGTPFTVGMVNRTVGDEGWRLKNALYSVKTGKMIRLSKDMTLEFVHVTHSTPHSTIVALHTKEGVILYAPDFKFDDTPYLEEASDYKRLKELKEEGVKALFLDSLYSRVPKKMPSEHVARESLRKTLIDHEHRSNALVGSCFSSHIARLTSFVDFAEMINRKVVFLGRTMMKYCDVAADVGVINLHKRAKIVGYGRDVRRALRDIERDGPENYVIVCTGGQGEEQSVLSRMMRGQYPFTFLNGDHMIFSNRVIPVEPNISNRREIELQLKKFGVHVFPDVHVSGHAAQEDIKQFIKMVEPEHVVPCHGGHELVGTAATLAEGMGYKLGRDVHLLSNGKKVTF
jgi:ribonuclease J